MAAAFPLHLSAPDAKRAWFAQELAKLTPDERARYDSSDHFRGFVNTTLEMEWRSPGCFERVAAMRDRYGNDAERELADLEAGRHPLQTQS
jgi:hypothetical protein